MMMVGILMLAILTLGSVSAVSDDNINSNLITDNGDLGDSISLPNDELINPSQEDMIGSCPEEIDLDSAKSDDKENLADSSKIEEGEESSIEISIPDKIINGANYYDDWSAEPSQDYISIHLTQKLNGIVTVYKDGEVNQTIDLSKEEYEEEFFKQIPVYGNSIYNITVIYEDDDNNIEKSKLVNVSYIFELLNDKTNFGSDELALCIPQDLDTEKLSVKIDGKSYNEIFNRTEIISTEDDTRNIFYVKISPNLIVGNHTCQLIYSGDEKYPARSVEYVLLIMADFNPVHDGFNDGVTLKLPANAKGNLKLYAYDFKDETKLVSTYTQKLVNGEATVSFEKLGLGWFSKVIAKYTGTDYLVNDYVYGTAYVCPKFSIPKTMYQGDSKYVSLNLPGKNGTLKIKVWDAIGESTAKVYSAKLVNGTAKISLSSLKAGKYSIDLIFIETLSDGKKVEYDSSKNLNVFKQVKFITSNSTIYYGDGKYKVKLTNSSGKALAGKYVSFKINGKYITKVKTNKTGWAVFKIPTKYLPKKYKFTVSALGKTYNRNVTVKQVLTIKSVKVRKYASKLALTATLKKGKSPIKSKYLTFKFNGKTFKAKTNKKGIAKVTVKKSILRKLKIGKKVKYQVTYIKDAVKKSSKVRR